MIWLFGLAGVIAGCENLPGADALMSNKKIEYVVVGEMHGTNEAPPLIANLACAGNRAGRPVTVAVEQTTDNQPFLDAFMASDGGAKAVAALFAAPMWNRPFEDGRSSKAIFALLNRLRTMRHSKIVDRIIAIDPVVSSSSSERNRLLAENVSAIPTRDNGVVLTLIGGLHAQKRAITTPDGTYPAMAQLLTPSRTLTFVVRSNGGTAWTCFGPADCGPHEADEMRHVIRGIRPADPDMPFDGTIEVGTAATPSYPAHTKRSGTKPSTGRKPLNSRIRPG